MHNHDLCWFTQSDQKDTCHWSNIRNVGHLIYMIHSAANSCSRLVCRYKFLLLSSHFYMIWMIHVYILPKIPTCGIFGVYAVFTCDSYSCRFDLYKPMHEMWKEYMRELTKSTPYGSLTVFSFCYFQASFTSPHYLLLLGKIKRLAIYTLFLPFNSTHVVQIRRICKCLCIVPDYYV